MIFFTNFPELFSLKSTFLSFLADSQNFRKLHCIISCKFYFLSISFEKQDYLGHTYWILNMQLANRSDLISKLQVKNRHSLYQILGWNIVPVQASFHNALTALCAIPLKDEFDHHYSETLSLKWKIFAKVRMS